MQASQRSGSTLSAIIVVNNYNYGRFLHDSVGSALAQTYPNTRIVVIDDGSTDNSRQILEQLKVEHPHLELHYKPNGGQLSCFNAALPYIRDADWVFLLDADDHYPANYVEQMLSKAQADTAMLLAENVHYDARIGEQPLTDSRINNRAPIDVNHSAHLVAYLRLWLGQPTSALAVRSSLYRLVFSYYPETDWEISADQVIVRGTSIAGGSKRFVRSIGINYRVHGKNNYHGTDYRAHSVRQRIPLKNLTLALIKQAGLDEHKRHWPLGINAMIAESASIKSHHRRQLNIPTPLQITLWPMLWPVRKCRAALGMIYRWVMSRHAGLAPMDQAIRTALGKPPA